MLVYCPECETACSERASTCPKCGHPVGAIVPVTKPLSASTPPTPPVQVNVQIPSEFYSPRDSHNVAPPPPQIVQSVVVQQSDRSQSSLGTSSLVLGVIAFLICWIPLIGIAGGVFGALGLLLGVLGFFVALCRGGTGIGYSIAGTALCAFPAMIGFGQLAICAAVPRAIERSREISEKLEAQRSANINDSVPVITEEPEQIAPVIASTDKEPLTIDRAVGTVGSPTKPKSNVSAVAARPDFEVLWGGKGYSKYHTLTCEKAPKGIIPVARSVAVRGNAEPCPLCKPQ